MEWNEWFEYRDGRLYWLWGRNRGKEAGFIDCKNRGCPQGYRRVQTTFGKFMVHRVIYELHHGAILNGLVVDHINGKTVDNRIENLRAVTQLENSRNRNRANQNNSSGYPNVSFRNDCNKWAVAIYFEGKNRHVGLFNCPTAAAIAAKSKKKELYQCQS